MEFHLDKTNIADTYPKRATCYRYLNFSIDNRLEKYDFNGKQPQQQMEETE